MLFKKTVIFEKSERQRILFTLILLSGSTPGQRRWEIGAETKKLEMRFCYIKAQT